jgi:hypothetical protein
MWNSISYLSVASAASTVTLSSVASRCGSPRSKYLMSKSKNGKISCTQLISATTSVRKQKGFLKDQQREKLIRGQRIRSQIYFDYLVLDRFPEHPGHLIACTPSSAKKKRERHVPESRLVELVRGVDQIPDTKRAQHI